MTADGAHSHRACLRVTADIRESVSLIIRTGKRPAEEIDYGWAPSQDVSAESRGLEWQRPGGAPVLDCVNFHGLVVGDGRHGFAVRGPRPINQSCEDISATVPPCLCP